MSTSAVQDTAASGNPCKPKSGDRIEVKSFATHDYKNSPT